MNAYKSEIRIDKFSCLPASLGTHKMVKVVCVLLVVVVGHLQAAKLPKFIVPCSKSDPNLNECAKQHGQDAIPSILEGNAKFKVPNLVPLHIPQVDFSTGDLHVELTNVTIHGLERTKIEEVHIDLENQHFGLTVSIDVVSLIADYNISGSILTIPLSGEGKANVTLVGGEYKYHFNYTLKEKKKGQYIEVQDDEFTFNTKNAYFQLDNLLGEESEIGKHINKIINDDWESVQAEVGPVLKQTVSTLIKSIVTGFTNKVPFRYFFLP
ncbi:protein takeout-like [Photinus pyralis]|uniref:Uncharacterized protein n=1 Tax=Photinus pyralis TaxID=7054 RepID=A0A1Y1KWI7_PHOPY|nr:protein takeout-like [Photinus pyralis]